MTGLHFRVGDSQSLAEAIRRAVSSSVLWETLQGRIPEVYKIEDSVAKITEIYRALLDHKS